MVLWDYRTIHCGTEINHTHSNQTIFNKKIEVWKNLHMTSYYPHKNKLCSFKSNIYKKQLFQINSIEKSIINDLDYRLIGYNTKF